MAGSKGAGRLSDQALRIRAKLAVMVIQKLQTEWKDEPGAAEAVEIYRGQWRDLDAERRRRRRAREEKPEPVVVEMKMAEMDAKPGAQGRRNAVAALAAEIEAALDSIGIGGNDGGR